MKIWTLRVILWSHLESLLSLLVCFGDHPVSQQTLNRALIISVGTLPWNLTLADLVTHLRSVRPSVLTGMYRHDPDPHSYVCSTTCGVASLSRWMEGPAQRVWLSVDRLLESLCFPALLALLSLVISLGSMPGFILMFFASSFSQYSFLLRCPNS